MNIHSTNQRERGIALMIVLFALLLLSVVGLGMMYSTNMETSINGNYRDKQVAFYAALAGLQEGRERIRNLSSTSSSYNITPPSVLPSTSAANVIYIVSNANTVKPWLSSNSYFDTEFCQEHVTSPAGIATLLGMPGVPCSAAYSTATWYQTFDDSLTSAAPWNLTNPLDLKWTRITLKGNNMTPYPVNGNSSDPSVTCWSGSYQMSTPTGYTTGCQPQGGVTAILVTNSGGGYTSTGPTITICGTDTAGTNGCPTNSGPGSGATGTANMAPQTTGYVSALSLTTGGTYTTPPTVTIVGDGTGATATAVLSSTGTTTTTAGSVTSVILTTGGSGYTIAPTVTLTGGGGSGAVATAVLSTTGTTTSIGYVVSPNGVTVTNGGKGYTSAPTVNFMGGGGMGATATATLGTSGEIVSVVMGTQPTDGTAQCFSQPSDVVVTFSGGSGSGATAVGVLEATRSCIYSVTPMPVSNCSSKLSTANGYNPADQKAGITFTSGNQSFSGTLFVSNVDDKRPLGVTVQKPGYDTSGYTVANFTSALELYGPPASAWSACNNLTYTANTGYRLASLSLTNGGSGYPAGTTVTISGGIGSNEPTATATVGFPVASVTVTGGGSNYNSAPDVSFTGGGAGCSLCTDATATASIVRKNNTTYSVAYVTVNPGGLGYTSAPTVSFSAAAGSGAAGTAAVSASTVTTYPVASLTLNCDPVSTTNCIGYTTATVSFSGGGGLGAAATATLGQKNSGAYSLSSVSLNLTGTPPASGSGYTSNPAVMITGGGGSGAVATSLIGGGAKFGKVWMITSLAQTSTGARSMLQMEVGSPVLGYSPGGALTLDGPSPIIGAMPNSNNFVIQGTDANSCGQTADPPHPAIDGYDDPNNPTNPSAVTTIVASLPRPDHYTGAGPTPSVQNGYGPLGPSMTTPDGLNQLIGNITSAATTLPNGQPNPNGHIYTGLPASPGNSIAMGSCPTGNILDASCQTVIDVVQGNLTLTGNPSGYGILLVEGTLTMSGDFSWHGPVFVVGDGIASASGGGTGSIQGNLFVAKIWNGDNVHYPSTNLLSTNELGSPSVAWNGGGNNGITFDHCWTTDLMSQVPSIYYSSDSYKVLSFRILPY